LYYTASGVIICDAKQTKQVHQYKNKKIKLYKCNAAIWYNKTCRIKQLIPTYVNIRRPKLYYTASGIITDFVH